MSFEGLVEEAQPISFRIGGPSNPSSSNPPKVVLHLKEATKTNLPMASRPDTDPEVIILDDIKDDKPYQAPIKKPVSRLVTAVYLFFPIVIVIIEPAFSTKCDVNPSF